MSNLLIISLSKFFYWQDKFSPKSPNLQIWLSNVGMCILNIQTWLSNFGKCILNMQTWLSNVGKCILNMQTWLSNVGKCILNMQTWLSNVGMCILNIQTWLSNVGKCILNIQTWLSNFGNRIAIPQQVFSPAAKHDKKCLVSTLALVNYGEGTSLSVVFGSQTTSADGNTWVYNQNFFKI